MGKRIKRENIKNDSARIGTRNPVLLPTVKPGLNRERVAIIVPVCLLVSVAVDRCSAPPPVANFTAVTRPLFFPTFRAQECPRSCQREGGRGEEREKVTRTMPSLPLPLQSPTETYIRNETNGKKDGGSSDETCDEERETGVLCVNECILPYRVV